MSGSSSEKSLKGLHLKTDLALCAIIVLAAVFLAPILRAPLLGDDAFNSYLTGYTGYHGIGVLQLMRDYDSRLVAEQGRYLPGLTIVEFAMWTFTQSALTIKTVQIIAILSDLILFYFFVAKFGRSRSLALWSTVIAVLTFQIRLFYDPYAGVVVVMQVVMACLLGSFILMIDEVDGPPTRWRMPLAVLLYAAAALTYEIAYLYVVAIFCLAWFRLGSIRPAIRMTLAFLAVAVVLALKDVYLRHFSGLVQMSSRVPVEHREYVITFIPAVTLATWFWQTVAAVPLVYFFFDPRHYLPSFTQTLFRHSAVALGLFVFAAGLGYALVRSDPAGAARSDETPVWQVVVLGVLLTVLPGFLIALSPRWQAEVVPGMAYVPVYEAGFGIAVLIATTVVALLHRGGAIRTAVGIALPLAFALVLVVTYQANALTLAQYDPVWNWGRQNLTQSVKLGLLNATPPGASIFLDDSYPFFYGNAFIWDSRYLLYLYSDKRVAVFPQKDIGPAASGCEGQRSPCVPVAPDYQLFNVPTSYDVGYDALVKITRIAYGGAQGIAAGDEATIVERGDESGTRPALAAHALAESDFTVEAAGPDWRRFHVRSSCGPVNADVFSNGSLIDVLFGDGFYGAEHAAGSTWHWAKARARVTLANSVGIRQRVAFDFTMEALDASKATVRVSYDGKTIARRFSGGPLTFHVATTLAPLALLPIDVSTDAPKPPGLSDPRDLHERIINERATSLSSPAHC